MNRLDLQFKGIITLELALMTGLITNNWNSQNYWVKNKFLKIRILVQNGMNFNLEAKLNQGFLDKVRELYFHKLEKLLDKVKFYCYF